MSKPAGSPLACPETGLPLEAAPRAVTSELRLGRRRTRPELPSEGDHPVLMRADGRAGFPVVDGIPIMMVPESYTDDPGAHHVINLGEARYAESYEERSFYTEEAERHDIAAHPGVSVSVIRRVAAMAPDARGEFPRPASNWVSAIYDCTAAWEAAEHIAPVRGQRVLQLGGTGADAVKMLLAGAAHAWLLTPVVAEARFARRLGEYAGVGDKLSLAVGIGEEMPFADASFDVIYSGGSFHHTVTALAFAECERVLRPGGRFAAVDPWRAALYGIGTRLLGKREVEVFCRPIDRERLNGISVFSWHRVSLHGTLTRYPLIAAHKAGLRPSLALVWRIMRLDDRLSRLLRIRGMGSSVALLARK